MSNSEPQLHTTEQWEQDLDLDLDQEQEGIYIAIPPPLVSPLTLQLDSSRNSSNNQLPTPTSSQSYTQWAMDGHFRQTQSGSAGSSQHQPPTDNTRGLPTFIAPSSSAAAQAALVTPVSPPPISLPAQLLNRLYPFSTMATPSTDISCASSSAAQAMRINNNSQHFSVSGSSFGSSSNSSSHNQSYSTPRSHLPYMTASGASHDISSNNAQTESTRSAAAAIIANSIIHSRDIRAPRGSSPYIPSSLSMLFTDPEIMQVQEEMARTTDHLQRRHHLDSQHTLLSEPGQDRHLNNEGSDLEDLLDDHERQEHRSLLGGTDTPGPPDEGLGYGYEVMQDHEYEGAFQQDMSREDYIAPHEPTSSSPLFPSPLTTLGRFGPGTMPSDLTRERQAANAGRIWQDYGTMGASLSQSQSSQQQPTFTPPMNQSHAAYYHAVSNHSYSSQEESQSNSTSTTCVPTGHYAVPEDGRWRRPRGRGPSHQSYASAGSTGGWSRQRLENGREDNCLRGILISIVSCWVCCESPAAAPCCSSCCL
ncbi:hypothetical protein EMPS_11034 [Entomortierella parvispora]|uniref:Uncharacterized protein n=1 Tax=Entomortierella parvispora TaxID=205924 RepID=A0A9P3HKY7_9FUNG|nr:hypothetical protein EMPS_11034 [Entomortierella parvispora]